MAQVRRTQKAESQSEDELRKTIGSSTSLTQKLISSQTNWNQEVALAKRKGSLDLLLLGAMKRQNNSYTASSFYVSSIVQNAFSSLSLILRATL